MYHWRRSIPISVAPPPAPATARADDRCIELAFTGRSLQRGAPPWQGLNLGGHVGDDPAQVEANRSMLAADLGVARDRLLFMNQVHGTVVAQVDGPWRGAAPEADAIITTAPDLALAVLVADCVPVLLHDAAAGLIAAVHAGRPGMAAGIVPTVVERLRELGARQLSAVVGPSVCGRCYEVPAPMAAEAAASAPSALTRSWAGTPALDVSAGVVEQLARADVAIEWLPGCTREDHDLYSYRRDGRTGRFAGVILRRSGRGPGAGAG